MTDVQTHGITRRFLPVTSTLRPSYDSFGFVEQSSTQLLIDQLLKYRCILIRGVPWIGKTYLAKRIYEQRDAFHFGNVWYTPLERHSVSNSIVPREFAGWKTSPSRTTWVIDSIDEGELIDPNISARLIDLLRGISAEQRRHLQLMLFVRASEIPDNLAEDLQQEFAEGFIEVDLLGLDIDSAKHMVSRGQFNTVLDCISQNKLHGIASLPAAIDYIAKSDIDVLSEVSIWKGMLERILREKSTSTARRRFALGTPEVHTLFDATARIAAIMTFAGVDQIEQEATCRSPTVTEFFESEDQELTTAGRYAIRTEMFLANRFVQKNVREWMTAFGIAGLSSDRIAPLLTNKKGQLAKKHWGVLSPLFQVTEHEDVREWILEMNNGIVPIPESAHLTLVDVQDVIESLAQKLGELPRLPSLWGFKEVRHLNVPGAGRLMDSYICDASRSTEFRTLLIDIVRDAGIKEFVPYAKAIVRDIRHNEKIRYKALNVVLELGGQSDVFELRDFACQATPVTRLERSVVSAILYELLTQGAMTLAEVARFAPTTDDTDVIGQTELLLFKLREQLDVPTARVVFDRFRASVSDVAQHRGEDSYQQSLIRASIDCILRQDEPSEEDFERMDPLTRTPNGEVGARRFADYFPVARFFRLSPQHRRSIYLQSGEGEEFLHRFFWLAKDDSGWLMQQLPHLARKIPGVWNDLLLIDNSRTALEFVKANSPEAIQEYRERNQRLSEAEERARRMDEEFAAREIYQVEDVVEKILGAQVSDLERARHLTRVCFCSDQQRPRDIQGTWDDLDESMRARIECTCRSALTAGTPSEIASVRTLRMSILFEATCFKHFVLNGKVSISDKLVRKWLPAAILSLVDEVEGIINVCLESARHTVEDVTFEILDRELSERGEPFSFWRIPQEMWTIEFANRVRSLLLRDELPVQGRAKLLRALFRTMPQAVLSHLDAIADGRWDALAIVACDISLTITPVFAWKRLLEIIRRLGLNVLKEFECLRESKYFGSAIDFRSWPPTQLEGLFCLVEEWLGNTTDESEIVVEDMRRLRDTMPQILLERGEDSTLQRLTAARPELLAWYEREKLERATRLAIAGSLAFSSEDCVPFQEIKDLLGNPNYRIVRTAQELFDVVSRKLRDVGAEAGKYIEMLYLPGEFGEAATRRHESALQAYLACRLHDILPSRVLRAASVVLNRESQGRFRRRTDILVQAPLIGGGIGAVVIEVKWSDNDDARNNISTALKNQLGKQYLVEEGHKHGIFFVGWNGRIGTWRSTAGKAPSNSPESLEEELSRQAREFRATNGVEIAAIVADLEWPEDAGGGARRRKK